MAILLVEHDVQLVMQVCTRIHVLDFGAILAVGTPAEIQQDQAVLDAYLGAPSEALA
jgi:ABC-type branched-subunit amino acid transport system ATPase component